MDIKYAESLFNFLYSNLNGYEISNRARADSNLDCSNLLYGELPFETFAEILKKIQPKEDSVFFDLGSGTGRVVLQAYLMTKFRKCIGVELLGGLHNKAIEVQQNFDKTIRPQIEKYLLGRELHFAQNDLFKVDYAEADLIFMNHPLKDSELFLQLEEKLLKELKPGTKLITIIRAFKDPRFKPLGSEKYQFSWGSSTAHFFEV